MALKLGKLFGGKKLDIFKKEDSIVGIDIGTSSIKVVQLKSKGGKAVLETYGEIALGPYHEDGLSVGQATNLSGDKLTEALSDLMTEANVTTKRASVSIPLKSSLLEVIELPSFKESQLEDIIPIEARKYIPVPISEVELDWWVIPKSDIAGIADEPEKTTEDGKEIIEVLIVAIHKDTISMYNDIVSNLGLSSKAFEVETFSSIRSVLSRDLSPVAILDIGATTSKLTIVDYGIVKVSHTISTGSQDVTKAISTSSGVSFGVAEKKKREDGMSVEGGVASSAMNNVFYEANRIIGDFQKRKGRLVSKVILSGGGSLMKGLQALAQNNFESEVVFADPFRNTQAPEFLSGILEETGPSFSVAVGLALRGLKESS